MGGGARLARCTNAMPRTRQAGANGGTMGIGGWLVCLLCLSTAHCAVPDGDATLDRFFNKTTEIAKNFAEQVGNHMANVIDKSRNGTFQCKGMYHACGDDFGKIQSKCLDLDVDREFHNCGERDSCTPVKLHFSHGFLRNPPDQNLDFTAIDDYSTIDDKTQTIVNEICLLESLDTDIFLTASESKENSKHFKGWSYIGTPNGIMSTFPGAARDRFGSDRFGASCEPFDPLNEHNGVSMSMQTLRPWFAPAMSPRKAVVILVHESAKQQAEKIFARILTTLTYSDFVSVLVFDSKKRQALDCSEKREERKFCLNEANLNTTAVNDLKSTLNKQPMADILSAFKHAFEDLRKFNQDSNEGFIGNKMILFMASDTFSPSTTDKVLKSVAKLQDPNDKVSILGYSFDALNSDDGLARQLACENDGVFTSVDASADMKPYNGFNSLAAEHADIDPSFVHYSPPYVDADHLGLVITTSIALYETPAERCPADSPGPKRRFMGVAGNDKQVQVLEKHGLMGAYEEALKSTPRPPLSIFHNVTSLACQLQILRKKTGAECPARRDRDLSGNCFRIGDNGNYYYMENDEHATFNDAKAHCERMNGKLASSKSEAREHFPSVVPRLGAWIELECINPLASGLIWGNRGPGEGKCTKIDPRGRTNNIVKHRCEDKLPYVCKFEFLPEKCEGSEVLDLRTKEAGSGGLLSADQCEENNTCKPPDPIKIIPNKKPVINWPPFNTTEPNRKEMLERVCCSVEEFDRTCPQPSSLWPIYIWGLLASASIALLTVVLWAAIALLRHKNAALPPQPIAIAADLLSFETRLGSGFSGVVLRGIWDNKAVALKTFYYPDRLDAKNELGIFRKLPLHPNIISCFGVQDGNEEGTVTLILELMQMNLEQFMLDCTRHRGISYRELFQVFYNIASGLEHLHKHNFLHLDLKPRNVLINLEDPQDPHSAPIVKLCDFGMSTEVIANSINLMETRGTPGFMAPEIERGGLGATPKATRKADIYSLGIIMQTCLSKPGSTSGLRGSWETLDGMMPLIQSCTRWDPRGRPSSREVCVELKNLMKKDWANRGVFDQVREPADRDPPFRRENSRDPEPTPRRTMSDGNTNSLRRMVRPTPFDNPPSRSWMDDVPLTPPHIALSIATPESIYNDALSDFSRNP